jgi:hypothetical protein
LTALGEKLQAYSRGVDARRGSLRTRRSTATLGDFAAQADDKCDTRKCFVWKPTNSKVDVLCFCNYLILLIKNEVSNRL